jgi:lysozyme
MPEVLPAKTRAAFISLGYNIGKGAFCRSQTIQGAFKRNDLVGACNGILLFDKAGGKKVRGLTIRRQEENVMCLQGLREGK